MISVTTPGSGMLATKEELQAVLPSLGDDPAELLIKQATAMIEARCSRVLQERVLLQVFRPCRAEPRLTLAQWPVSEIASIVVDGETLAEADHELDGSFLYRLDNDTRVAWSGSRISIAFTAGYAEVDVPADLKRACIDLCVNLNAVSGRDQTLRTVDVPDVERISYRDPGNGGSVMPESAIMVLEAYREIRL